MRPVDYHFPQRVLSTKTCELLSIEFREGPTTLWLGYLSYDDLEKG